MTDPSQRSSLLFSKHAYFSWKFEFSSKRPKLLGREVRHLTMGCGVLSLYPEPGVTIHMYGFITKKIPVKPALLIKMMCG